MTRKDYILIAQVLVDGHKYIDEDTFWVLVNEFGLTLKTNNTNYNHSTFVTYIKDRV